jgi:hypothetical protein
VGRFNVYANFLNVPINASLPLWSTYTYNTNNDINNNEWQIVQIPIGHGIVSSPYKVIFEKIVDISISGLPYGIFIDDIFVRDQSCSTPGDCDFENGFCTINWIILDSNHLL